MVSRWLLSIGIASAILSASVAGAQTGTTARSNDPLSKWQQKMSTATRRMSDDEKVAHYDSQLQDEVALQDEQLATTDAQHALAVSVWAAAKAFSESTRDPQKRAEFVQAVNVAHSVYYQTVAQAQTLGTQNLSQQWNTLAQSRGVGLQSFGQAASEAQQTFVQTMQQFDGRIRTPDISDILVEPSAADAQVRDQAELAFTKQVNAARTTYHASIDQASAKWKQSIDSESKRWDGGKVDQADARRINRTWLDSARDALDDLRTAYRSALRKYKSQVVD